MKKILRSLSAPLLAFWCKAIHRDQRMTHHPLGKKHLIVCKTCEREGKTDRAKNLILTFAYFNQNPFIELLILPAIAVAILHEWCTGLPGSFEYPPGHELSGRIDFIED